MADNMLWMVCTGSRVIVFPASQGELAAGEAQRLRDQGLRVFHDRVSASEVESIEAGNVPPRAPLYRRVLAAVTGRPSPGSDFEPLTIEYRH